MKPARKRPSKPRSVIAQADTENVAESVSPQTTVRRPSHEDVAFAAYTRYLSRQGEPGSDFDDWLAAERDLMARSVTSVVQE